MPLSYLWNKCFSGMPYDSQKVQDRLLQMPLVALTVNGRIYIVERILDGLISDYESLMKDICSSYASKQTDHISGEEYDNLLHHVAQNEPEREILKHVLCSTHNLSKRKGSELYGISLLKEQLVKVNDASNACKEIKKKNLALAKQEKRNVLLSFGLDPDEILMSDSEFVDTSTGSSDERVKYRWRVWLV